MKPTVEIYAEMKPIIEAAYPVAKITELYEQLFLHEFREGILEEISAEIKIFYAEAESIEELTGYHNPAIDAVFAVLLAIAYDAMPSEAKEKQALDFINAARVTDDRT